MARDYTKYNVFGVGENLNKRSLVFNVVKDWVSKNNPSFEEIIAVFTDEVQGSYGFIKKEREVKDPKRFNMKEPLAIKNGMHIVVSNQWGDNIVNFIQCAEGLGYSITAVSQESNTQESSGDVDYSEFFTASYANNSEFHFPWKPEYGLLIRIRLENSPDMVDIQEYIHITIDPNSKLIIGAKKDSGAENDDEIWFGGEALLWSYNIECYESAAEVSIFKDLESFDSFFKNPYLGYTWHDKIEDIDGDLPDGLTEEDLNSFLNGRLFSGFYGFIKNL